MTPVKNIRDVEIEIKKALTILKAMPSDGPKRIRSSWPKCLNEDVEQMLYTHPTKYTKVLPEEIDDMDEVLEKWLKCLDYHERNLVIMRCSGCEWKTLIDKFNSARSTLYGKYVFYLKKILRHVMDKQQKNSKGVK